jgi:hypothetical protein
MHFEKSTLSGFKGKRPQISKPFIMVLGCDVFSKASLNRGQKL